MAHLEMEDYFREVEFEGNDITIGSLYSIQIKAFERWWNSIYERLRYGGRIEYVREPEILNPYSKKKLKFIAKLDKSEYEKLLEEYNNKINELTEAIPTDCRYAFYLSKKFKYLNTKEYTLQISDAYTVIAKNVYPSTIKNTLYKMVDDSKDPVEEVDEKINELISMEDITEEQRTEHINLLLELRDKVKDSKKERKKEIDKEIDKLDKDKLYVVKQITANRFQVNYYDFDKGKSSRAGLGDALFMPKEAVSIPAKRRKKRSDMKEIKRSFTTGEGLWLVFEADEKKDE